MSLSPLTVAYAGLSAISISCLYELLSLPPPTDVDTIRDMIKGTPITNYCANSQFNSVDRPFWAVILLLRTSIAIRARAMRRRTEPTTTPTISRVGEEEEGEEEEGEEEEEEGEGEGCKGTSVEKRVLEREIISA